LWTKAFLQPHGTIFRIVSQNLGKLGRKCDRPKKTRPKIGRELINQGASTYLISGSTLPLSGQFDKISENWAESAIAQQKTRPKIGRELIIRVHLLI
jgi:hypothetical protein